MGESKRKIGIMGGTFDPIHIGHLILGEKAYEQFGLEKVLFLPAGNPPHKKIRPGRATDSQRIEMVKLAIADNAHFELSLIEMQEQGYSYTYRTLERMKREYPDEDYYFIIGADSLFTLEKWREPGRICQNCKIAVAVRDHTDPVTLEQEMERISEKYGGIFVRMDTPNVDISSALIRKCISAEETIRYYVPDPVRDYIYKNRIYHVCPLWQEAYGDARLYKDVEHGYREFQDNTKQII
ncbi:MAG: nicotinate-nucleotide adenylyltransferase [Lachnospiraceae bacterium]|nr:nicotinate-nucleotide adenylyltransferase [Lachnospiraceae bacterium]